MFLLAATGVAAGGGLPGGKRSTAPDYGQPFTLRLDVRVATEHADLQPLYDALERQGFRTHIRVRQGGDAASGVVLVAEGVDAWRYDDFTPGDVAAIARDVKALVRPFGGVPSWSYRQNGVEGRL